MPAVSDLIGKFLRREALSSSEQSDILADLGVGKVTVIPVSGATLTLSAANAGTNRYIRLTGASAVTITVDAGLPAGLVWIIRQVGAGVGTVGGSGITVLGNAKTAGQNTSLVITHAGGNSVDIEGGSA